MALHQRATKLLLALSLCAAVAACGGQTVAARQPATSAMPGMSTMESSAPSAPVATDNVVISNFAFGPQTVTVRIGTTVTWTNKDTDEHTVTAQDGSFNSAPLATNATYQHTFTKAGTYGYLCTIHPFMTATVVVTP